MVLTERKKMQKSNKATILVAAAIATLVLAGCSSDSSSSSLKIGSLLPETGSLAFLGPPEFAGVDLAVAEINAAGGVLVYSNRQDCKCWNCSLLSSKYITRLH